MDDERGGGRRLGLRVGLNTGEVLAGVQAHLTYTVVGDTVNTASRLSDAAGVGAVYAGRDTALGDHVARVLAGAAAVAAEGQARAGAGVRAGRSAPARRGRLGLGDEAPFVGRDAEFGRLVGKLLDVVERGHPSHGRRHRRGRRRQDPVGRSS